jgi:hypothetical protein
MGADIALDLGYTALTFKNVYSAATAAERGLARANRRKRVKPKGVNNVV